MIYTMTTYLRLFLVNTLDLFFHTYQMCYSNCFYYKHSEHNIRRTNSNELELCNSSPINITSQPITISNFNSDDKSHNNDREVIEMNKIKSPTNYEWDILEESFST